MKRARFAALLTVSVLLATTLSFQSCNVIRSILGSEEETNSAPTVSLSEIYGDYTATAGETLSFYANAYDADYDSLTYTWYVNGTQQYSAYTSSFSWNTSGLSPATYTISVTVSDGKASASASVYAYVLAGNTAPTVSLSVSNYYPYSDENVTFTANAYDADGDSLTFTWNVNGSYYTTTYGSNNVLKLYWLADYTLYSNISVTVADGNGGSNTSSTAYLTISAGASLRVENYNSSSVYYLYVREASSSSWGSDRLGSTGTIPTGYMFKVSGLIGGYSYDYYAQLANGYTFDTNVAYPSGFSMINGYYRYFDINANNTYTVYSNSNANIRSMTDADGSLSIEASIGPKIGTPVVSVQKIASTRENLSIDRDKMLPFIAE